MSQTVMHSLPVGDSDTTTLVPILIKVQQLQRRLLSAEHRSTFARAWNWVDAHLQCVYGADSDMYMMLRQALMGRRVLLLLDGIDEGGEARDAIESEHLFSNAACPRTCWLLCASGC